MTVTIGRGFVEGENIAIVYRWGENQIAMRPSRLLQAGAPTHFSSPAIPFSPAGGCNLPTRRHAMGSP